MVRLDPDAIGGLEPVLGAGDDVGTHALFARCTRYDEGKVAAGRREQVKHAIQRRGRDFRHREDGNIDLTVLPWHGRIDRLSAFTTLVPNVQAVLGCLKPGGAEMTHGELRSVLHGELLEPGDAGYDDARVVWNGMIDKRPALIVRCRNAADVLASVNYARVHDLAIAVRSGGHNVAGYAVCDGGLMIDMRSRTSSPMSLATRPS